MERKCLFCQKVIKTSKGRVASGRGKFCSPEHKTAYGKSSKNPNWKGGETVQRGYVLVRMPFHPFANANGYIKKSRVLIEEHLRETNPNSLFLITYLGKKYLMPECRVEYLDGNKSNLDITNLKVLPYGQ